jgi:hypothetical protein
MFSAPHNSVDDHNQYKRKKPFCIVNPCPGTKLAANSRVTHSVFRKDPDSIATLFCFSSVWVEDPQTEGILLKDGSRENSVRSDAEMTMADEFDIFWGQIHGQVGWMPHLPAGRQGWGGEPTL